MKNKRFAKIATLVLAAALLLCCVIGIGTSAEEGDATEVSIAGKNLSYEGAIKIVYYVDASNFDAETQTLKMNFWIGTKSETPAYVKEYEGDIYEREGKTYYAIFSNDIAPVDMTKPIYAQPFIENSDGSAVVCEEVTEYSVYTYAMNRFSQSPTADQLTLYKALLDYGAAVQSIFPDDANVDVYGWADAYYDITKYVFVDDVLQADESLTRATPYRPSEIEVTEKGHLLGLANSTLDGAYFKNITDEDGVPVDVQYVLPGTYTYNVNYTTAGTLNDFSAVTDVNTLFIPNTSNALQYQAWWSGKIDSLNTRAESGAFMLVENGSLVTGADCCDGGWQIDINNGTNLPVAAGVTYVVAFDYKIAVEKLAEKTDGLLAWFGVNYSEDGWWSDGEKATQGRGANIVNLDNYFVGGKTYINNSSATVPNGEWFNIRVEYEIVSLDNAATAENDAKANVRIYVDGVLAVSTVSNRAKSPESLLLYTRADGGTAEYHLDNLYVNSYAPSNMKGAGAYNNGSASTEANKVNADGVTDLNTILSANGFEVNNKKANNALYVNDKGEIIAKTEGTAGSIVIAGPNNAKNDGERGVKYVAELDIKVTATNAAAGEVIGTLAIYADDAAQNKIASVDIVKNVDGTASIGSKTLNPNTWYNIRLEYTIIANGYNVDGVKSFDGKLEAYVFTDLAYTANIEGEVDNRTFGAFGYAQGAATSSVALDNFCFDYVALAGTKGNGAYYKQHVENAAKDITTAETFIDFTGKTSITTAFKGVSTSSIYTNNNKLSDSRYIVVTGSEAMLIGGEGQYNAETLVTFNAVTASEGEKIAIEFDYLFLGSDGNTSGTQSVQFYIRNGSTNVIRYDFYGNSKGTGISFRDSNNSVNYFSNAPTNKWYNIRIEITYGEAGSTAQVYIDNVKQGAARSISADASSIDGFYINCRNASVRNQHHLFDNIVIDNTSASKTSSYYGQYNAGNLNNGTVMVEDFDTNTDVTKFFDRPSSQFNNVNRRPTGNYINQSYVLVENGALVMGTNPDFPASSATVKLPATEITSGSKIIVEFMYKYVACGAYTNSGSAIMLDMGLRTSSSGLDAIWYPYHGTSDSSVWVNPNNNNDGKTKTLVPGTWYKFTMEIDVTDSAYTTTYYVDGAKLYTRTTNSALTLVDNFRFAMKSNFESQEHSFDNFVFAVIPAAE